MEDLKKLFKTMFNVIRLDLENESYYLLEDSESKCYLMPSWRLGLFQDMQKDWKYYGISELVFLSLRDLGGGEWIKREGKWLC